MDLINLIIGIPLIIWGILLLLIYNPYKKGRQASIKNVADIRLYSSIIMLFIAGIILIIKEL